MSIAVILKTEKEELTEQEELEAERKELFQILKKDGVEEEEQKEIQERLDEIEGELISVRLHTYTHGILDIVIENWDYFKANTVHLAWAMMQYELCHRACNLAGPGKYGCMDNPKYPVLDRGDEHLSDEDSNLFYDAWGTTISNAYHFPDANPNLPLGSKKNKTVQNWIDFLMNPDYEYTDQYPTEERVIDWLFCVYGAGHGWNKEGFIDSTGPSGVGEAGFAGYTRAEDDIREDLFQAITALSRHEEILADVMFIWSEHLVRSSGDRPACEALDMAGKIRWEFGDFRDSKPTHLISELLEASKYLCYFEELCRQSQRWTIEEWAEMRKKEVVVINGFEMKVEDFRDDFEYPAFMMSYTQLRGYEDDIKIDPRIHRMKYCSQLHWLQEKIKEDPSIDKDLFLDLIINNTNVVKGWPAIKNIFSNKKEKDFGYKLMMEDEELQVNVFKARNAELLKDLGLDDKTSKKKVKKIKAPKERSKFYPMCHYSNAWTMPKNADKSYVDACVTHMRKIVADPLTDKHVLAYAFRVLKRLRRKPYDRSTDGVQRRKIVLRRKKAFKAKIDTERYC